MTAHLQLISTTAEPAEGDGADWTAIEEGARFAQEMVRDAQAAGLCVSCWQVGGADPRHCWGNGCRNQASARTTDGSATPPKGAANDTTEENTVTTIDRDQLAQDTAEYIVNTLMPDTERFHGFPEVTVHYADDKRPPTTVDGVKAHLLSGGCWISWMDDRVVAAMRALHGEPTGDARLFTADR